MTQPKTASKFTPGPWLRHKDGEDITVSIRSGAPSSSLAHDRCICQFTWTMRNNRWAESEANARLIAKAPEMYELLEKIALLVHHVPNGLIGPVAPLSKQASRIKAEIDGEG